MATITMPSKKMVTASFTKIFRMFSDSMLLDRTKATAAAIKPEAEAIAKGMSPLRKRMRVTANNKIVRKVAEQ
jgi:hypothetical protein